MYLNCGRDRSSESWSMLDRPSAGSIDNIVPLEPSGVVLETRGGLEMPLASELELASLPVSFVNPRQVRNFARATGRLAKTDAVDAQVLAQFPEAVVPPVRHLPDADTRELRGLVDRRPRARFSRT